MPPVRDPSAATVKGTATIKGKVVAANQRWDPAFLEGLRDRAKKVRVDDTGAPDVALTLKKPS